MEVAVARHDRNMDTIDEQSRGAAERTDGLEQRIADALVSSNLTAAVAESLTGGNVSAGLSAIEGASDWFLGGVVAYAETVKFDVLDVDRGPVITAKTAEQMARGVSRLLHADLAVATTGVGGPGPQEDLPQGTVFIAVATPTTCQARRYQFEGDPSEVVRTATRQALQDLAEAAGVE
jgi:nicotinamide-nucleotide amidase